MALGQHVTPDEYETAEVEQDRGSPAPSAAGQEGTPWPPARRPSLRLYECDHCGEPFAGRNARGAHMLAAHPIRSGPPAYTPEPERHRVRRHPSARGDAA